MLVLLHRILRVQIVTAVAWTPLRPLRTTWDIVTNGKGSMPASADKLSKKEIEEVAQYVMDQSEKGW